MLYVFQILYLLNLNMKNNEIVPVVISLGSNISPQTNIILARNILFNQFHIIKETKYIVTQPIRMLNQSDFINGAMLIKVNIKKDELYKRLKLIELQLGRKKTKNKYGSRKIDLDIVVFGKQIVDSDFYKIDFLKDSVLQLTKNRSMNIHPMFYASNKRPKT